MNHSDQAYLVRSHGTTVTLHREETQLSFADYSSGDGPGPPLVLGNLLLYRQFFCLGSLLCCLTSIIGYPVAYVLLPSLTGLFYLTDCMILCSLVTAASLLDDVRIKSCRCCSRDNSPS